jgi:hypothetical protein
VCASTRHFSGRRNSQASYVADKEVFMPTLIVIITPSQALSGVTVEGEAI